VERSVVAVLAGAIDSDLSSIAPYLAIPPLIGGVAGRRTGMLRVWGAETLLLTLSLLPLTSGVSPAHGLEGAPWVLTGVRLGLQGASMPRALTAAQAPDADYRDALDLITGLHELRGRLSEGLDVVHLADALLFEAASALPVRWAALFVRNASG